MRRALAAFLILTAAGSASAQEYLNGIEWKKPDIITPGVTNSAPPSDAVVLFDGKDLSHWKGAEKWKIDGDAIGRGAKARSLAKMSLAIARCISSGQHPHQPPVAAKVAGNSGLFLMGKYELQILDSYENETYYDGQAGAIYKQRHRWPTQHALPDNGTPTMSFGPHHDSTKTAA